MVSINTNLTKLFDCPEVENRLDTDFVTYVIGNFSGVNMKGVNLEDSQMTGVNLRVACLKNANLKKTNLRWAVLAGTDLEVREMLRGHNWMHFALGHSVLLP